MSLYRLSWGRFEFALLRLCFILDHAFSDKKFFVLVCTITNYFFKFRNHTVYVCVCASIIFFITPLELIILKSHSLALSQHIFLPMLYYSIQEHIVHFLVGDLGSKIRVPPAFSLFIILGHIKHIILNRKRKWSLFFLQFLIVSKFYTRR